MIVKLVEVNNTNGNYKLNEVYLNSEHVVSIRPVSLIVNESQFPDGLDKRTEFSNVYIDHGQAGMVLTVVGPPEVTVGAVPAARPSSTAAMSPAAASTPAAARSTTEICPRGGTDVRQPHS